MIIGGTPDGLGPESDVNETYGSEVVITNVRLAHEDPHHAATLWKVTCQNGKVSAVSAVDDENSAIAPKSINADGSLMLPSLCHSHIHLDKCFILDKCGELINGDFNEAMRVTGIAKSSFPLDVQDLYNRGERVIRESIEYGVTVIRAHVEVDSIVGFSCLDMALSLRQKYSVLCDIQIAVFAQEPLYAAPGDTAPGVNFHFLEQAALRDGVTVVGSAPYVEPTPEEAKMNISLIFGIAKSRCVDHIDFHLDYNLDPTSEPLIYEVIKQTQGLQDFMSFHDAPCPRVTIGHATRLQLFTSAEWTELANAIQGLPISFIGLPQSDMYMQGRNNVDNPLGPPRSTLRVPQITRDHGVQIAMSVNNVDNAYTPQGSLDPLSLCTFGVGVFQTITPEDLRVLVQAVTITSKKVIGQNCANDLFPTTNDPADFVILHGQQNLRSAALNPTHDRTTIRSGVVIAKRRVRRWLLDP